jgi:hypothetical protein
MSREWFRGPQWSSIEAREQWAPVLARAKAAWTELESLSVSAQVRPSSLVYLSPSEVVTATRDAGRAGLEVTPLAFDASTGIRAAIHHPGLRPAWLLAWEASDDETIGKLLGFPPCCVAHFARTWVEERRTDTVLTQRTVDGPAEANVLLRQLGVRLVPHLPCSADCEPSVDLGRAIARAGEEVGVDVAALRAVLGLAVEYSALHGVAAVSTEPFRFTAGTDYTEAEVVVRRAGTSGGVVDSPWADNGFSSPAAMERAHAVLLGVVGEAASALDLGCGDGSLLGRIARGRPGEWWGVEVDAGRAARGWRRNPIVNILTVDLARLSVDSFPAGAFDVAFLMPLRLVEIGPEAAERVRAGLRAWARRVVVYNYDGRELNELCAEVGLDPPGPVTIDGAVRAAVLGGAWK